MRHSINVNAVVGLAPGGTLGMAGAVVPQQNLQARTSIRAVPMSRELDAPYYSPICSPYPPNFCRKILKLRESIIQFCERVRGTKRTRVTARIVVLSGADFSTTVSCWVA